MKRSLCALWLSDSRSTGFLTLCQTADLQSALHGASYSDSVEVCKFLLTSGADVNALVSVRGERIYVF